MVSHLLPVVIALKKVLERRNSPLQRPLMEYLVSLMKHHKHEGEECGGCLLCCSHYCVIMLYSITHGPYKTP